MNICYFVSSVLAASLLLLSSAAFAQGAPAEKAAAPSFDGTWVLTTKGARGKINKKIEPVVQEHFSFVTRSFARSKLKTKTKPYKQLVITVSGAKVSIKDSRGTASTPNAKGKKTTVKRGGDSYKVEQYAKGNTMVEIGRGDGGERTGTY